MREVLQFGSIYKKCVGGAIFGTFWRGRGRGVCARCSSLFLGVSTHRLRYSDGLCARGDRIAKETRVYALDPIQRGEKFCMIPIRTR